MNVKHRWLVLVVAGLVPGWLSGTSVHDLKAQYQFSCAQCHGPDGTAKGLGGIRLPGRVLADPKWLAKQKTEDLVNSILNGKGAMPGFKYKLTPDEARHLLLEVIRPMARRAR